CIDGEEVIERPLIEAEELVLAKHPIPPLVSPSFPDLFGHPEVVPAQYALDLGVGETPSHQLFGNRRDLLWLHKQPWRLGITLGIHISSIIVPTIGRSFDEHEIRAQGNMLRADLLGD